MSSSTELGGCYVHACVLLLQLQVKQICQFCCLICYKKLDNQKTFLTWFQQNNSVNSILATESSTATYFTVLFELLHDCFTRVTHSWGNSSPSVVVCLMTHLKKINVATHAVFIITNNVSLSQCSSKYRAFHYYDILSLQILK